MNDKWMSEIRCYENMNPLERRFFKEEAAQEKRIIELPGVNSTIDASSCISGNENRKAHLLLGLNDIESTMECHKYVAEKSEHMPSLFGK